jgi:hypothetical protein
MNSKRDKLIKNALLDKINDALSIYTADDILTAADITETELQEFHDKIKKDVEKLADKNKK